MPQIPLGDITPNSTTTAQRATVNRNPTTTLWVCQAVQFQILESATSYVYICGSETPTLSGGAADVHVALHPDGPVSWSVGNPAGSNPLNAAEYWILPAVAGEGVRATALKTGPY